MVIRVDGLSKLYRLGVISSSTITQDFNRLIARIKGKEDPYQKIGAVNNRLVSGKDTFVWALKDVSLDVHKGDILGIIGKNGAGKSTLLKILSRVTSPTRGSVKVKGRIASLLEVGTGFHQELTGRENIYLNGSILGMTKSEIDRKFDEIVDFSGVGTYVDTPVKRYSSGMSVRLAFAVAAHLEPEILIVDEVLAVGDAEFQSKCIGKMQEVSRNEGRTVLFVSHNMGAISNLCTSAVLMENGMLKLRGSTEEVISNYLESGVSNEAVAEFDEERLEAYFTRLSITSGDNDEATREIDVRNPFRLNLRFVIKNYAKGMGLGIGIYTRTGTKIFYNSVRLEDLMGKEAGPGTHEASVEIPGMFLAPGDFHVNISIQIENVQLFDFKENPLSFSIIESGSALNNFKGKDIGLVLTDLSWRSTAVERAV